MIRRKGWFQLSHQTGSPTCGETPFLPVCREDLESRGWSGLDIILISGDAYVDHPSYGTALIGRLLESHGFKVGIISQPDWKSPSDFQKLGRPRLFFGITGGNTDSMIANYSANKKNRDCDEYSPGGRTGLRPDRAVIVYSNLVRQAYKDVPIVLGGVEASLRRFAHYDYWDNRVRGSILIDSRADILVYGMGEKPVLEIAQRLADLSTKQNLLGIRGTSVIMKSIGSLDNCVVIPSQEQAAQNPGEFNRAFVLTYNEMNPFTAGSVVQKHGDRYVVQYPPPMPLSPSELDQIYELPYRYSWHPSYNPAGGVPGYETVRFSITSHRGCCGECSFCSIYFHQGRIVQSRSQESIVREAELLSSRPDFKGTITDIGGPTANMYSAYCHHWAKKGYCRERKCLTPEKCSNFHMGYQHSIELLRKLRKIPRVKHVFIGSGFRYDLLTEDYADRYLQEICEHHISGLIKVAPEHCSDTVLRIMNKPSFAVYEKFVERFKKIAHSLNKKIFIVNYFICSHPGTTLHDALKLALYLAKRKVRPEQIQDFLPSPMTAATCIYHTKSDPFSGKSVYVPLDPRERKMQRALAQYDKPGSRRWIMEALEELKSMHVVGKLLGTARSWEKPGERGTGSRTYRTTGQGPWQDRTRRKK
ncbi:MAG: YgiQ family radical SAM protein [Candidatus Wallbacteria bacterium]|nr:YgiQ family radical SAM protein [Candidatus Wallbacteria bacterium]